MSPHAKDGSPPVGVPLAGIPEGVDELLTGLPADQAALLRAAILLGEQRSAKLQRLQGASAALSRTLDEGEIMHELARGVLRVVAADGVVVGRVDLDAGTLTVTCQLVAGTELTPRTIPLPDGALARAARTGEMIVAEEPATDGVVLGIRDARAFTAIPLTHGRRLLGVVGVHTAAPSGFSPSDLEALRLLASQAASALSNAYLFAESERERRQSDALAAAARAVGESLRMGEVLRLILRHATALLRAEGGYVALTEGEYVQIVAAVGAGEVLKGMLLPIGTSLEGRALRDQSPLIVNDVASNPDAYRPPQRLARVERAILVPLATARGPVGTITLFNRADDFTAEDARVLQRLADQVAVAVVNARLYEELSESTREWTSTFDAIGSAMVIVNDDLRIVRYNSRALHLANFEGPRELVGRPFYETFIGEPPASHEDRPVERAMRDAVLVRGVLAVPDRGTVLRLTAAPHANGGAIVTFEEERTPPQLLDRNARVLESSLGPLLTTDKDGRVTFANPAARELLQRGDVIGTLLRDLVAPEIAEELLAHQRAALDGSPQRGEYVALRRDGERHLVHASLAPLDLGAGVEGLVVTLHDVTSERRGKGALAVSEARYRALFERTSDGVFTLDFRGAFTSANPVACTVFGAGRDQLLGRSFYQYISATDVDRMTVALRDALAGQSRDIECVAARPDGGSGRLAIQFTPLRHGRQVVGVFAVMRDVSEQREPQTAMTAAHVPIPSAPYRHA